MVCKAEPRRSWADNRRRRLEARYAAPPCRTLTKEHRKRALPLPAYGENACRTRGRSGWDYSWSSCESPEGACRSGGELITQDGATPPRCRMTSEREMYDFLGEVIAQGAMPYAKLFDVSAAIRWITPSRVGPIAATARLYRRMGLGSVGPLAIVVSDKSAARPGGGICPDLGCSPLRSDL